MLKKSPMAHLILLGLLMASFGLSGVQSVGVCYGMMGNNLPSAQAVVNMYKSHNIDRMRIYDPNRAALEALRGTNIELMIGVPNDKLQSFSDFNNARAWIVENVQNFNPSVKFRCVVVGNEVSPVGESARFAPYVLKAIMNTRGALDSIGLNWIKVSTAIDMTLIGNSYPPSQGSFRNDVRSYLDPIIQFQVACQAPLLANVYTYFSYSGNPRDISLQYALFQSQNVVVWDAGHGYTNLFDAMMDALYSALERAGGGSLEVIVSESGWPSGGGFGTSMDNAKAYLSNLINHVKGGTPKRPRAIETYLFAMFDENNKWPELEKNFGLFYPNQQSKYNLNFNGLSDVVSDVSNSTMPLVSDM